MLFPIWNEKHQTARRAMATGRDGDGVGDRAVAWAGPLRTGLSLAQRCQTARLGVGRGTDPPRSQRRSIAFPLGTADGERPLEGGGQRVKTRTAPRPY